MREIVNFMGLMKEGSFILDIHIPKPKVFCKIYKYKQICITVAESNKFSPRKKYVAIKYHHFQSFVNNNIICICYIDTR